EVAMRSNRGTRAKASAQRRGPSSADVPALPISLRTYVELLEEVGAALRTDKPWGSLSPSSTSALERLGIAPDHFVSTLRGYTKNFFTMVGHRHAIDTERDRLGMQRVKGSRAALHMYA